MKTFALIIIVFLVLTCLTVYLSLYGFFLAGCLLTASIHFLYRDCIVPIRKAKKAAKLDLERRKRILDGRDIIQTIFKDVDEYGI